jgi:hypothetical protein
MTLQRLKRRILSSALLTVVAPLASALAQPQYFFIEPSNTVSPEQPSVEIDVWAAFDPIYYAFAGAPFDIGSVPDEGMFYDPRLPKNFYGDEGAATPDGDAMTNIVSWQYQYPPNMYADTANPIMIWSCSWTTSDFTPRRVDVNLLATDFWVYFDVFGQGGQVSYVPEALGYIQVVPDPGAAVLLVLGAFVPRRRREQG